MGKGTNVTTAATVTATTNDDVLVKIAAGAIRRADASGTKGKKRDEVTMHYLAGAAGAVRATGDDEGYEVLSDFVMNSTSGTYGACVRLTTPEPVAETTEPETTAAAA